MAVLLLAGMKKTNILDDRNALITDFGTATLPIYSTEPAKEGVGLSARSAIEDFFDLFMFDILWQSFAWITLVLLI